MQDITIYKNANNGINIKEDLIDFGTGRIFRGMSSNEEDIFSLLGASDNIDFKKKRYFFNNTHYFSTNTLTQIAKNKHLRFQGSYLHEKEKQQSNNSTLYLLPDATILITEKTKVQNLTNKIGARLTYDSNTERTFIKNTLNINSLFASNNGNIEGTERIEQKTNLDRLVLSDEFSLVRKFKPDKVFRFNSINEFNRLPQRVAIYPGLYKEFTGDSIMNEQMIQNASIQSFNSHSFTSFSHSLAIFGVDYNLGVNLKTQLLKSSPDNNTSNLLNAYADSLSNYYRFTETNFYLSPKLRFQREYINISLTLNSTLKYLHRTDFLQDNPKQNNIVLVHDKNYIAI